MSGLVDLLGLKDYILYMQDYGGPVGFRLFTQRPEKVKGFIIQNANAYMEGVGDAPKGYRQVEETMGAPSGAGWAFSSYGNVAAILETSRQTAKARLRVARRSSAVAWSG